MCELPHGYVCVVQLIGSFFFQLYLNYGPQILISVLVSGSQARILMPVGLLIQLGLLFPTELLVSQFRIT